MWLAASQQSFSGNMKLYHKTCSLIRYSFFTQTYSGHSISEGKIQYRIKNICLQLN